DGSTIYYGYDNGDRLTSMEWIDGNANTIYAFEWDYDAVGNRTYEDRNAVKTYYEYDTGNELLRSHELPADMWTYFGYDSRGNCLLIQKPSGTTYFAYNDADLVTQIKYPGGVANYFYYDALNRRYAICDSAGLAYFSYDTDRLCPLAERDATGTVTAEYVRGQAPIRGIGDLAAARLTRDSATYCQYPVCDLVGNLVRVANQTGQVVGYFEYDPWGNKLRNEPPVEGTRFGQSAPAWLDLPDSNGELGLSSTRVSHRPAGRFLQRDPLRTTPRGYQFANDNPMMYLDPRGLESGPEQTNADQALADRFSEYVSLHEEWQRELGEYRQLISALSSADATWREQYRIVRQMPWHHDALPDTGSLLQSHLASHRVNDIRNTREFALYMEAGYSPNQVEAAMERDRLMALANQRLHAAREMYRPRRTAIEADVRSVLRALLTGSSDAAIARDAALFGGNECLVIEPFPCNTASEGAHPLEELGRILRAKGTESLHGLGELIEMAQRTDFISANGMLKAYLRKGEKGNTYVILKGYSGLRRVLTGTRYLENHPKVYDWLAMKRGGRVAAGSAWAFGIVTTVAFDVVEGILDHKTWTEIGISIPFDVAITAMSIVAGAAVTGMMAGSFVPVVGNAAGFVMGFAVGVILQCALDSTGIKKRIYEAIVVEQALELVLARYAR
ncbi:MAG: hypothetical protein WC712_14595, partial [Candidatus Brocadiia bacterium]